MLKGKGMPTGFVVYYQGGLGKARAIDTLVESMVHTSEDVSLVLVGNIRQNFLEWIISYAVAHRLENRVKYLGRFPYGEELFALCAGADLGVMFVKGDCRNQIYNATATNKLFEYMMMAVPVLTSDFPGHRALVEAGGFGVCVNSEEPRNIAEGIMKLRNDPALQLALGRRGRTLAEEKYNWEQQEPVLLEKLGQLIH